MLIKFINHRGTGDARSAQNYLLQDVDHKGEIRPEVVVLKGNPDITTELANSLSFKHKYRTGVLAFSPSDMQKIGADKEKVFNEILDEWEQFTFAGMDKSDYSYYAVSHGDHIHFVIARTHLGTGKAFNPAPPGYYEVFDKFREYINAKYGFENPDEKILEVDEDEEIDIKEQGKRSINEYKRDIKKYILQKIQQGKVKNREDIKREFETAGFEINRQGKDYISIKKGTFKARFRGGIWVKDFNANQYLDEIKAELKKMEEESEQDRKERFEKLSRDVEKIKAKRSEYVANRYYKDTKDNKDNLNIKGINNDRNTDQTKKVKRKVSKRTAKQRNSRVSRVRDRIVRTREIRERKRDERIKRYNRKTERIIDDIEDTKRRNHQIAYYYEQRRRRLQRRRFMQRVQRTIISLARYIEKLARAERERQIATKEEIIREIEKMNSNEELQYFKQNIDLQEVAKSFGYILRKDKSSHNSWQYRKDDEIIVIKQGNNGAWIYNNLNDFYDKGTIINFLQNRGIGNLGEVRKWCREWLGIGGTNVNVTMKQNNNAVVKNVKQNEIDRDRLQGIWNKVINTEIKEIRNIDKEIIQEAIDQDAIKVDGNTIYFKLKDLKGICGIDKNIWNGKSWDKRLISGSKKGLWSFGTKAKNASWIVICESAIDAMSFKQLHSNKYGDKVLYISTSGQYGKTSSEILKEIAKVAKNAIYLVAMDNDKKGDEFAEMIQKDLQEVGIESSCIERIKSKSKDWNDDLNKAKQQQVKHKQRSGLKIG